MKNDLKETVRGYLLVPRKAVEGDENRDLEVRLGEFLVDKGFIKGIERTEKGWGFVYRSSTRKIHISEERMPVEKWEKCIFRLGVNEETGERFFPQRGEETKIYRFLHEVNHAYQEYLFHKESPDDPQLWCERALNGELGGCFSRLFNFCFSKREEVPRERGLSIWGSAPQYDHEKDEGIPNEASEAAVRALEDANELATMYVWHPNYFHTFISHLLGTEEELKKEGLLRVSEEEAELLRETVHSYVREMKGDINM